ncbi:MAG: hypothetical protein P8124_13575 [Gammaproteobacteria bacterium]
MFHKLNDKMRRFLFALSTRSVLVSPPMRPDAQSDLTILSMVQHKDVPLYLLAIKSFARYLPPGRCCVIDDGSLTEHDKAVLRRHVRGVEITPLDRYRSPACPVGGTWERLLAIAELVQDHYLIQLDADTLTVGPIDEVAACVADGAAFALGTWDRQDLETMAFRSAEARPRLQAGGSHVQLHAEAHLEDLNGAGAMKYVRGCSGFAGFPKGSFNRAFIEDVSTQMTAAIGSKWHEWGSEQVMSNIVLANIPGARVLPHPKYGNCQKMTAQTAFVHFIGPCRFTDGRYAEMGRQVVRELSLRSGLSAA